MAQRKRDTSAASAARFLSLRSKVTSRHDPRRPDHPQHITLQQVLVEGEYRYRETETGRVYTAAEARAYKGPLVTRYIDGGVSFMARYIDERPRST